MSLPKLYLETTIPSYLRARRSRDLRLAAHQEGDGGMVERPSARIFGRKTGIELHGSTATLPAMSTIICPRSKTEVDREVAAIRRVGKKIAKTKESARDFLIRTGLLTKGGKLAKRYR